MHGWRPTEKSRNHASCRLLAQMTKATTGASPVIELSRYAFSILQEGEFALYRGRADGLDSILWASPDGERSAILAVKRFPHEYALRTALDSRWAARPIALSRYRDRIALVLEDPGGQPLDRMLGKPLDRRNSSTSRSRSRLPAVACTRAGLSIKISSRPTSWWVRTGAASG